ncbi:ADRA2A [Branchiostoma lanceolatum]|uniref:ADRA2A protein n=1 Tax=Branchiostoma lanceolatum TaxID=7740 RepID=A0A8J9ZRG7_BRALA|nr:ADRA2A [Branchiostoma lanceolatum]
MENATVVVNATGAVWTSRQAAVFSALPKPFPEAVSVAVAGIIAMVGIIAGNCLVCVAVARERSLKAVQNWYLVSLAVCDLMVGALIMPFSLANEIMGYWYFGQVWCEVYLMMDVLACTASIWNLCLISLDRLWSVTNPIKHSNKRKPKWVCGMITVAWVTDPGKFNMAAVTGKRSIDVIGYFHVLQLLSVAVSVPPLFGLKDDQHPDGTCDINASFEYSIFSSVGSFFIPLVLMTSMYTKIFMTVRKRGRGTVRLHYKRGMRPTTSGNENTSGISSQKDHIRLTVDGELGKMIQEIAERAGINTEEKTEQDKNGDSAQQVLIARGRSLSIWLKKDDHSHESANGQDQECTAAQAQIFPGNRSRIAHVRERRFTILLGVILGAFILCWLPFFLTLFLQAVCTTCRDNIPLLLFKFFFWIGYLNSAANPIIYTVFNRDFRRAFKRLLCRHRARGQKNDTTRTSG